MFMNMFRTQTKGEFISEEKQENIKRGISQIEEFLNILNYFRFFFNSFRYTCITRYTKSNDNATYMEYYSRWINENV